MMPPVQISKLGYKRCTWELAPLLDMTFSKRSWRVFVIGFYYSWISVVIPRQEVPSKEKDLQKDVKLRILGFWHKDNGYMPDSRGVEYNASDSPCSLTLTDNVVAIPENVQKLFPDNPFWKVLNPLPTSYIAMAVLDTESGDYLGNVGMMDTQAGLEGLVGSPEHVKIGLRVFAERVGAELKRMRMEEAIRYAREDAVKANESKSQYMNHLNHELRTPMNAVIGMAELLDDTSLNESQRELVTTLRSSGAHLLSVINNVLDLTKIELGSVTLCNEPLEVAMILDEVVKMIRPSDVGISAMQRGAGSRSTSPAVTNPRVKPEPDSSPAARGRTSHSQDSARTLSPAREPGFADYKLIERQKSDGSQNLSSRAEPDCQTDACGRSDSCGPSRKRVEIKWEVGHDVPKFIEGDRGRLRQILINLLANAYKFTDTGHVIARCCLSDAADHAEAKQVNGTSMNDPPAAANPATTDAPHQMSNGPDESQTATKPREEIVLQFEVQDTGPGVPAEKAEDLFKPFVQLDTTRGQHSQGSGLGLTIAQHLVHLMGGRIWLKVPPPGSPSPTIGTTIAFTIRTHIVPIPELIHSEFTSLPRSMRLSSSSRASNSETSSSNGQKSWDRTLAERLPLKILLAEDDMLNARIAKSMFGKFGYTAVTHAVNGVEVLEAVRKAAEEGWMFDVLFCDIFMPEMDGYTTATKVKEFLVAHPEIKTAPRIIALTANASVEDRNKCLDLGMCAYMTKPLTIQELYESLVETGRVRSES
ncbi:hypothetical protein DFJ77DRAFT_149147 [Powellomyces hirtus]|nr:hypothetical protein DFJ77DRAFT_149147 [Powellomyces hirtus]